MRERTREAVREDIRRTAVALFAERGFDAVRTEEIAAASGISARSFFRYFATKEDVLVSGAAAVGSQVRDRLASRPSDEDLWTSLRHALDVALDMMEAFGPLNFTAMTVIMTTPALRASHFEKHLVWEEALLPEIAARLSEDVASTAVRTWAHTAMGCLDVALFEWVRLDAAQTLPSLLNQAFATVSGLPSPATQQKPSSPSSS